MTKIFLYGAMTEHNFGGPSLLQGVRELITSLPGGYEMVYFQHTPVLDIAVEDMGFPVYQKTYTKVWRMILDGLKVRLGFRLASPEYANFWNHLKSADIVADLSGICFCSDFSTGSYSYPKALKLVISTYLIPFIAKHVFHKKTVKCTASFGPIRSPNDLVAARFAAKHIFDVMVAREEESFRQMREVAGISRNLFRSPDMANMMPHVPKQGMGPRPIGISVSHQIIKQWKSGETYIDCISKLIDHVARTTGRDIVLIPNDVQARAGHHDGYVAQDILTAVGQTATNVSVLDVEKINSTQLKSEIGWCELFVGSRYHACVAALSSGVPTLVVGWHHKYDELLELYGQGRWIIGCDQCSSRELIATFDELWNRRDEERKTIVSRGEDVRRQLMEVAKVMFT